MRREIDRLIEKEVLKRIKAMNTKDFYKLNYDEMARILRKIYRVHAEHPLACPCALCVEIIAVARQVMMVINK